MGSICGYYSGHSSLTYISISPDTITYTLPPFPPSRFPGLPFHSNQERTYPAMLIRSKSEPSTQARRTKAHAPCNRVFPLKPKKKHLNHQCEFSSLFKNVISARRLPGRRGARFFNAVLCVCAKSKSINCNDLPPASVILL